MIEEELLEDIKVKGLKGDLIIPIYPCWIEYKGETFVSQLNFERTADAGKPMFDLSYCMTKALNQCIMKTVQYDKSKFIISRLENEQPSPPQGVKDQREVL